MLEMAVESKLRLVEKVRADLSALGWDRGWVVRLVSVGGLSVRLAPRMRVEGGRFEATVREWVGRARLTRVEQLSSILH